MSGRTGRSSTRTAGGGGDDVSGVAPSSRNISQDGVCVCVCEGGRGSLAVTGAPKSQDVTKTCSVFYFSLSLSPSAASSLLDSLFSPALDVTPPSSPSSLLPTWLQSLLPPFFSVLVPLPLFFPSPVQFNLLFLLFFLPPSLALYNRFSFCLFFLSV